MSVRPRFLVCFATIAGLAIASCGGLPLDAYASATSAWRGGEREQALDLARRTYQKFRDDNDLAEGTVRAAVDAANRCLEEEIVLPRGERPRLIENLEPYDLQPETIAVEIRADLLSGRATAILRAAQTVDTLKLVEHAQGLLAVVFRRPPVAADGGVLESSSVALRSVAAKRAALDVLERLR